jgi:hypothetical protein
MSSASMSAEESRQRAPSMIASSSIASSNASYPEEMMMMAAAAAQHANSPPNDSFGNHSTVELTWQSPQQQPQPYYAENHSVSSTFFDNNNNNNNNNNSDSNYYSTNTKESYVMPYAAASNPVASMDEQSQSMTIQPNLSAYYPHDFGLKQNDAYSLMDTSNNMTFVAPRHPSLVYSSNNNNNNSSSNGAVTSSPSFSPVHPAYHENSTLVNDNTQFIQRQQNNSVQSNESSNTMSLLSHHQSLF